MKVLEQHELMTELSFLGQIDPLRRNWTSYTKQLKIRHNFYVIQTQQTCVETLALLEMKTIGILKLLKISGLISSVWTSYTNPLSRLQMGAKDMYCISAFSNISQKFNIGASILQYKNKDFSLQPLSQLHGLFM